MRVTITFPSTLAPQPKPAKILRRVRRWGDSVMTQYGFDYNNIMTSNFQAVKCFNKETGFGAVSNFLYIPHEEVMNLRNMQFTQTIDGKVFNRDSKMNWLCAYRGKMYMYDSLLDNWATASRIRWGTLTLGGNLVQVEKYEIVRYVFGTEYEEKTTRDILMARLVGFQPSDWLRPLADLLAEGLVHRCYCVYKDNGFGDTPKGIIYSPFYSPKHYKWNGKNTADALYIPEIWLESEPG